MKKTNIIFILLTLFSLLILSHSCTGFPKKKVPRVPIITINPSLSTMMVEAGQTYDVEIILTPDIQEHGAIGSFKIYNDGNLILDTVYSEQTESVVYVYKLSIALDAVGGEEFPLTFQVSDVASDEVNTLNYYVKILHSNIVGEILEYQLITLEFNNALSEFEKSTPLLKITKDIENDTILCEVVEPSENGDIALAFHSNYGKTLGSPDSEFIEAMFTINGGSFSANGQNHTKLMKYTGDYTSLTIETIKNIEIISHFDIGDEYGVVVIDIVEDECFVFETHEGVRGVIKISTGQKKTSTNLSFEIKVFQEEE